MKKLFTVGISALLCIGITVMSVSAQDALDRTSIGYGMGRQVDSLNRPTGADEFNAEYSEYDAYAVFPEDSGVTLTFDCGYENGNTAKILDTLKEKNVKAIFFITGDYAKKEKSLVRRMIDEGHIVGNHGMKHKSLPALDEEALASEIMTLHDFVKDEYGYEMTYLRPPCGEFSEKSLYDIQNLGYTTLMWSFAYVDWEENSQPDRATALERVLTAAHGGEIALLHAVSNTNAEILGDIIDGIRGKGLEFSLPGQSSDMGYFEKFRNLTVYIKEARQQVS
jgi:peptidoglycan-N-acetylmuramic acid deacetylase